MKYKKMLKIMSVLLILKEKVNDNSNIKRNILAEKYVAF